jgi:hypothetical protein
MDGDGYRGKDTRPHTSFPPKPPQQHKCTASHNTINIIHTYYTSHPYEQLCLLFT